MLMEIRHHQKSKLNRVVNQKSVNQAHGLNGQNVMLNATNSDKCSVTVNAIVQMAFLKKTKNVVATLPNVKPVKDLHAHALATGQNGLHAMANAAVVNEPESAMIHAYQTLFQKLMKKCAKKNSVPLLNGPNGLNAMHHSADGVKSSVIVIAKVIATEKILTVAVEI